MNFENRSTFVEVMGINSVRDDCATVCLAQSSQLSAYTISSLRSIIRLYKLWINLLYKHDERLQIRHLSSICRIVVEVDGSGLQGRRHCCRVASVFEIYRNEGKI